MPRLLPQQPADKIAFFFMLSLIHIIVVFELFIIIPYIDSDTPSLFIFHFCVGFFFYFNILSGIWFTIKTDTTSGSSILPSILKPGWRFCSACESNAPPRSFHCWLCNRCILKRDHHCTFTGNCIGHFNQRYYITLVSHLTLAAIYCNYLNMDYTWEVFGSFSVKSIFTMFLPLLAWVLGYSGTFTFVVSFVSSICVLGCMFLMSLFCYHFINLINGQTTQERAKGIKEYNIGTVNNFHEALGSRWYIALVSPWIKSPLPGDGITFAKRGSPENIKDI